MGTIGFTVQSAEAMIEYDGLDTGGLRTQFRKYSLSHLADVKRDADQIVDSGDTGKTFNNSANISLTVDTGDAKNFSNLTSMLDTGSDVPTVMDTGARALVATLRAQIDLET